ncbi:DUF5723 family protein [Chitinophaga cymbidii]|uniref:DUF5723 family protein n=1 Tax=Chitinophaga cymbidii TaxID=1096750 RepID=UPI0011BE1F28|nr:DUF5723 family protein [Chitinophaga cymbidii]
MFQRSKKCLLLITGLFAATAAQSQIFPGYHTSQYAGIHAVPFNPASAAGSRYRWDVNIVGADVKAGNTYYTFDKSALLSKDSLRQFIDYFPDTSASRKQYAWGSVDLMLPSALYAIDERQSIAFTWRLRGAANGGGVETSTANFFAINYPDPKYYDRTIAETYAGAYGHSWNEFGFSYARTIKDYGDHRWKAGITLKYLSGQAAGYGVGRDGSFMFKNRNQVDINSGKVAFAWNEELSTIENNDWQSVYSPFQNPGIGADIGIIYEWRPDSDGFGSYEDGTGTWNPDADTWKARFGISVVDIGGISYTKAGDSRDMDMTAENFNAMLLNRMRGESLQQYAQRIGTYFSSEETEDKFYMNLPTSINLMGDYNLNDRFFISASATIGLLSGTTDDNKNHALTQLLITPRYETRHIGAYLPFSVNRYGQADAGLGLRLGPLVIGSASLFSNLARGRVNHADAFVALRVIPIRFSKWSWDKGGDGIFRKRKNNLGCPPL